LRHGFSTIALHGDMDQSARTAALDQFRKGEVALLVASDVAARGLDIPDVSHIFNFDVPHHPDDYVHRIGRTGRAGRSGTAITIVAPPEQKAVAAIEKLIGQSIPWTGGSPQREDAPVRREPVSHKATRREPVGEEALAQEEATGPVRFGASRAGRRAKSPSPRSSEKPGEPTPGNVMPIEAARRRQPPAPDRERTEDVQTHLPAFLLRPFRAKA
jgi:superfamily II DNA/RNA helicase